MWSNMIGKIGFKIRLLRKIPKNKKKKQLNSLFFNICTTKQNAIECFTTTTVNAFAVKNKEVIYKSANLFLRFGSHLHRS